MRRRLIVILALLTISATAIGVSVATGAATSGDCTLDAVVPGITNHTGQGRANVNCTGAPGWTGQIRLTTQSGTVLAQDDRSGSGSLSVYTYPYVACGGHNVHSFIWINVNGVVKSDGSANVAC